MTIFNYKQCFKNDNKAIVFICFLPIYTNPTVEIAISYIIVRNLRIFVPFLKEINIAYRKECFYDKNTYVYQ